MEAYWTKKRIAQLSIAEPEAVNEWLDRYVSVIYTWLYYQVGADVDMTVDLTISTISHALSEIGQFQPANQTMFQWLRNRAKQARDEVLTHQQTKPQKPWAWSQLGADVLSGLSILRNEALSEEVVSNPAIQEMVQASLAELEETDRELMMHRYNHLHTPEHIAGEIGLSIEKVNDRLYRCRHFFRKVLMQLVQSENMGFTEAAVTGNIELLDTNLEKLLSSTAMYQPISDKDRNRIEESVTLTAQNIAQNKNLHSNSPALRIVVIAATIVLVLGSVALLFSFLSNTPDDSERTKPLNQPKQQTLQETSDDNLPKANNSTSESNQEQLNRIVDMGKAGNITGLLEILKDGEYSSQVAASLFVSNLGDESAIGLLEESEAKWYPNGPDNNPFARAIIQIENRLLEEADNIVEEVKNTESTEKSNEKPGATKKDPATKQTPPAPPPAISGIFTGISGQPVSNARITLSQNPLYAEVAQMRILDQIGTDNQGRYGFPNNPNGAIFLAAESPRDNNMMITRSFWCEKEKPILINFGGPEAVFGTLNLQGRPSADQILYLSDTLDPSYASFRAETITDTDGRFSFIGVPADNYYLLNNTESNRILWISTLEVPGPDISNWQVNVRRANITVHLEQTESSPTVTRIILAYGTDVSTDLQRFVLQPQEDGTFMRNVPFGSYTLIARCDNGMRLQQQVEINQDRLLTLNIPQGSSNLTGQFSEKSRLTFFLYNTDHRIRFDLQPDTDGFYSLKSIPPDVYSLATVVHNLQLDLLEVDLQTESQQVLDINPRQLLRNYCPLYVVITDAKGMLINDAQVWITGDGEVVTTQSTGRGAFLAAPAGEYSLHAAYPGRPATEKVVTITQGHLQAAPNPGNTVILQIEQ